MDLQTIVALIIVGIAAVEVVRRALSAGKTWARKSQAGGSCISCETCPAANHQDRGPQKIPLVKLGESAARSD